MIQPSALSPFNFSIEDVQVCNMVAALFSSVNCIDRCSWETHYLVLQNALRNFFEFFSTCHLHLVGKQAQNISVSFHAGGILTLYHWHQPQLKSPWETAAPSGGALCSLLSFFYILFYIRKCTSSKCAHFIFLPFIPVSHYDDFV